MIYFCGRPGEKHAHVAHNAVEPVRLCSTYKFVSPTGCINWYTHTHLELSALPATFQVHLWQPDANICFAKIRSAQKGLEVPKGFLNTPFGRPFPACAGGGRMPLQPRSSASVRGAGEGGCLPPFRLLSSPPPSPHLTQHHSHTGYSPPYYLVMTPLHNSSYDVNMSLAGV